MDSNELTIRTIKLIDISYLTIIYVTIAITISIFIDRLIGEFDEHEADKKSTFRIILEIYINLSFIAIAAYIIRNIVHMIPCPLNGLYGFDHTKVKELNGGMVFSFALFYYQLNLNKKIKYLFNERLLKKN